MVLAGFGLITYYDDKATKIMTERPYKYFYTVMRPDDLTISLASRPAAECLRRCSSLSMFGSSGRMTVLPQKHFSVKHFHSSLGVVHC